MQLALLLLICIAPPIIALASVVYFYGQGSNIKNRTINALSLNEDKGLFKQGALWLSLLIPFGWFLSFGITAWYEYPLSINAEGFKKFLEISTLPLALLAIGLPASVLVSRLHATHQTARQISLSKEKNNVDAFYSHRKEFYSYFDRLPDVTYLSVLEVTFKVHPALYSILYKGSPEQGIPKLNTSRLCSLLDMITETREVLDKLVTDRNSKTSAQEYLHACGLMIQLSLIIGAIDIRKKLVTKGVLVPNDYITGEYTTNRTLGTTSTETIAGYRYLREYMMNICLAVSHQHDFTAIGYDHIDVDTSYKNINPQGPIIEKVIAQIMLNRH